jgi:hypothetical protein
MSGLFRLSGLLAVTACIVMLQDVDAFITTPIGSPTRMIVPASTLGASTMEAPTVTNTKLEDPTTTSATTTTMPPGMAENAKFDCDESVAMWRDFQAAGFGTLEDNLNDMSRVANRFAAMGPQAQSFFLKHLGRSAYFVVNALLGTTAFQLHERFVRGKDESDDNWGMRRDSTLPSNIDSDISSRLLLEALLSYEQDYQWIRNGVYREPWDMTLTHRQASPANLVTQSSRFVREAIGTLVRRSNGTENDKKVKYFGTNGFAKAKTSSDFYPEYYQNAFHYQTDGKDVCWMWLKMAVETSNSLVFTSFFHRQAGCHRNLPMSMRRAPRHYSWGAKMRCSEHLYPPLWKPRQILSDLSHSVAP